MERDDRRTERATETDRQRSEREEVREDRSESGERRQVIGEKYRKDDKRNLSNKSEQKYAFFKKKYGEGEKEKVPQETPEHQRVSLSDNVGGGNRSKNKEVEFLGKAERKL